MKTLPCWVWHLELPFKLPHSWSAENPQLYPWEPSRHPRWYCWLCICIHSYSIELVIFTVYFAVPHSMFILLLIKVKARFMIWPYVVATGLPPILGSLVYITITIVYPGPARRVIPHPNPIGNQRAISGHQRESTRSRRGHWDDVGEGPLLPQLNCRWFF